MSTAKHPETDKATLVARYKYLRVTDVCDAMDGIGYFNIGLMSPKIRPIQPGIKFWGVAFTIRCVPANRPMWRLDTTEDMIATHEIWFAETGQRLDWKSMVSPGEVIVSDSGGTPEVGFFGSQNVLWAQSAGAVGIVTDGCCRDSAEIIAQKTPICVGGIGRALIPGRIQAIEAQTPIACGGVQVRPGDIVGADDDGVIVVPQEVAEEVAMHATAIMLDDMRERREYYEMLGLAYDNSVDYDAMVAYYQQFAGKPTT